MKKSSLIICLIAFMGLASCGGNSEKKAVRVYGHMDLPPPGEPAEVIRPELSCERAPYPEECPANSVNGYWSGYGGYGTDEDSDTDEVEAIFLDGTFISFDDDSIVSGEYTIDNGELLSMDTKVYEIDGPYVGNIQIKSNQTVYEISRITADVVLADENSTLDLDYEPFSETAISYSDFAGDWYFDSDNELTYIAAVDEQGTFYSVVDECTTSGSISIPKTNLFIFDVELTIAGDECEVMMGLEFYMKTR